MTQLGFELGCGWLHSWSFSVLTQCNSIMTNFVHTSLLSTCILMTLQLSPWVWAEPLDISERNPSSVETSRKTSISALLTMPKPLTVDHNKLRKILKEMGIPYHLTCLWRNLYAGQEATFRTRHGTTDWFQIGKGIRQGCILSPCLFNFYGEYIMRNFIMRNWMNHLHSILF